MSLKSWFTVSAAWWRRRAAGNPGARLGLTALEYADMYFGGYVAERPHPPAWSTGAESCELCGERDFLAPIHRPPYARPRAAESAAARAKSHGYREGR